MTPLSEGDGVVLITGGAGFIGCNLTGRLIGEGFTVRILDNLSRPGSELNLEWLRSRGSDRLEVRIGDVLDPAALRDGLENAARVVHLAGQVSVLASFRDPVADQRVNVGGTDLLLEAAGSCPVPPPIVFASTNKVYGSLDDIELIETPGRYQPASAQLARGVAEGAPLDLSTPYSRSKALAERLVLDYARQPGLSATVLRLSCVYGPRQLGHEEQGWVSHFARRAKEGSGVTIFGDGKQVRDLLYVDDLVDALSAVLFDPGPYSGQALNLGGGSDNAMAVLEAWEAIRAQVGSGSEPRFSDWRSGDQRWFVADCGRFEGLSGWHPKWVVADGLAAMLADAAG